jgi:repressor LexA
MANRGSKGGRPLTAKQQQILDYIKDEILKKGYPPTVREICETVGLKSTSSVHAHLSTLERNGYIRRDPTKPRAIEICDDSFQVVRTEMTSLPEVGDVAAGIPILAQENIVSYFPVPSEIVPSGESFVLRVRGESMINAGILDGDRIFVNSCNSCNNGDIVVALDQDRQNTLKRYGGRSKESGKFRLEYMNEARYPGRVIEVPEFTVQGVVRNIIKSL